MPRKDHLDDDAFTGITERSALAILESISDAVIALDSDWRCTYVNAAAERLARRSREELLGRTPWDVVPAILSEWPRHFDLDLIGTAITSPEKGILEVNDKLCDILGYERSELLQKNWAELTHPDDVESDIAHYNRVLAGEIEGYSLDKRWICKDSRVIHSTISVKCLRRSDGAIECFIALLQDTSERKKAEEDRERFALLVENSIEFIGICDVNFMPLFLNRAGREMVGLDSWEETIRKSIFELFFPEDVTFIRDVFLPRVLREGNGKIEVRFRHFKTGEPLWMIYSVLALKDAHGAPAGLATLSLNITRRKEAEEELWRARNELELRVAERTQELSISNDELKKEIGERERMEREWAVLKQELAADLEATSRLNELSGRLFAADGLESSLKELLRATIDLQNADSGFVELYEARTSNSKTVAAFERGQSIAISPGLSTVQTTPLVTGDGKPLGALSTRFHNSRRPSERELRLTELYARQATQIIERQRVEEALRRSEAYLSMGQRITHTGTGSWNVLTGEIFWSDETYRICGYEPGSLQPSTEFFFDVLVHPDDRQFLEDGFHQLVRDRSKYDLSFRIIRGDGAIRYMHSVGEPVFREDGTLLEVIGAVVDATEQKAAEDALHRAQAELAQIARATTIGELAASIAHEANQPIAAIVSNGEACLKWINRPDPDWTEAQAAVRRMVEEGQRASEVIQRVRSLMKRAPVRMLRLGINELIAEVLILMQREVASHSISLRPDLADDLPPVLGDRAHLQQVCVNLVMNAIEATIARGEGPRVIVISSGLQAPGQIVVAIRDSGIGINDENVEQLFQPFFSNKADGMGMGLWISRSIVEAHGGTLRATRNEDAGATFRFTVPVAG